MKCASVGICAVMGIDVIALNSIHSQSAPQLQLGFDKFAQLAHPLRIPYRALFSINWFCEDVLAGFVRLALQLTYLFGALE